MSNHQELYDPHPTQQPTEDFSAVPLSPSLPSHPIAPDRQAYIPTPIVRRRPSIRNEKQSASFLDEILPTPSAASDDGPNGHGLLRRTGAVGIIVVFILVATFLAATDSGGQLLGDGSRGLRLVFGSETTREWSVQSSAQKGSTVAAAPEVHGEEEDMDVSPGKSKIRLAIP